MVPIYLKRFKSLQRPPLWSGPLLLSDIIFYCFPLSSSNARSSGLFVALQMWSICSITEPYSNPWRHPPCLQSTRSHSFFPLPGTFFMYSSRSFLECHSQPGFIENLFKMSVSSLTLPIFSYSFTFRPLFIVCLLRSIFLFLYSIIISSP